MQTFTGEVSTDTVGSECEFGFEVADDATDEEIEEVAKEAAFEYVSYYNELV